MAYNPAKVYCPSLKANTVRIIDRYNRALAEARSSARLGIKSTNTWLRLAFYLLEVGVVWLFLFLVFRNPANAAWETAAFALCFAFFFVGFGCAAIHTGTDSPRDIFKDPEQAALSAALNGTTEPISLTPLASDGGDALIEKVARDASNRYGGYDEDRAIVALIAHLQIESILARDRTV